MCISLLSYSRLMRSPCSLCLWIPSSNIWMPKQIFMEPGVYIVVPMLISTVYIINPFHQPLCLYVSRHIDARQRNNRGIVRNVVFCMVHIVWKDCVGLSVFPHVIARKYIGKHVPDSTKNYFRVVVFCAVRVMSEESTLLLLPLTSYRSFCDAVSKPERWPRDTPLSAKVGTAFRRQVAVTQSVWFARGLRTTEFVFVLSVSQMA
jgi:hypothetical protein